MSSGAYMYALVVMKPYKKDHNINDVLLWLIEYQIYVFTLQSVACVYHIDRQGERYNNIHK